MKRKLLISIVIITLVSSSMFAQIWSKEKANAWYAQQGWLVGCNYIPATAINQLEMWQAETFDINTIDKELGWAENIGFNFIRVFLHNLAWQKDAEGFKKRINTFLDVCEKHKIKVMFVFFDDCWNINSQIGKQPEPIPGVHNSGWLQSPGNGQLSDSTAWPTLEKYVKDIITSYKNDKRIILWDLYNEPGNSKHLLESLPLLKKVFTWAREILPSQPITAGVWQFDNADFKTLTTFQIENSDVITFHNYGDFESMKKDISVYKAYGRPVICSEYMARKVNSLFLTHLPLMKSENVGAVNWGFVDGKTQTKFPWDSPKDGPEPNPWFHEVFHKDGKPYEVKEIEIIKKLSGK